MGAMNLLLNTVYMLITIYTWLIVAQALLSWFPMRPGTILYTISGAISSLTEPYLSLFRRFLPTPRVGTVGIDLSAVVGLLVLIVVLQLLRQVSF
jgi:YggT family protein